jgi:hypothetical protein
MLLSAIALMYAADFALTVGDGPIGMFHALVAAYGRTSTAGAAERDDVEDCATPTAAAPIVVAMNTASSDRRRMVNVMKRMVPEIGPF